jgi:uncharacterized membrane protein YiaA
MKLTSRRVSGILLATPADNPQRKIHTQFASPPINTPKNMTQKPSPAFVGASWMALIVGSLGYLIGLWRADAKDMMLNEKGFYFVVLMFGLFSAVSLQKSVRDRLDNIPVSDIYFGICWGALIMSILLLVVGLFNASLLPSEKGYYAFSFMFALFGSVAVQKNTRDSA